jgi:hypothetical protein
MQLCTVLKPVQTKARISCSQEKGNADPTLFAMAFQVRMHDKKGEKGLAGGLYVEG